VLRRSNVFRKQNTHSKIMDAVVLAVADVHRVQVALASTVNAEAAVVDAVAEACLASSSNTPNSTAADVLTVAA